MYYALRGHNSGQILTYNGKVIVHDSPGQLQFLIEGATVVPYGPKLKGDELPLKFHPHYSHIPNLNDLLRKDFK